MATATDTQVLPVEQVYKMNGSAQNAYFNTLPKDVQTAEKAKLSAYKGHINSLNKTYLERSLDKYAICPPNGGGTAAVYAAGTTLNYDFPTAGGAYLREIEISVDIKFTPATGTSAVYAWSAAGALAWFTEIGVKYNGQLHRIKPYALKVYDTIKRAQRLPWSQVLSGFNADATITANVAQAQPAMTGGSAATSKFKLRIPLQLHRLSPVGMLPMQGQGTKGQISIQCAQTLGAANCDPMTVPINFVSGSGFGITLDATEKTVQVMAIYSDGTNFASKTPLALHLDKLPASQHIIEQNLTPLSSGSVNRQRIVTQQPHYFAVSVIIDGQSSTKFCDPSNITQIELDQDSAGQNKFFLFGPPNNTTLYDYYNRLRDQYGQDLDDGVIVWANALQNNTVDVNDKMGDQVLDMSHGHWTDVNYGVQVGTVSSTNFTPRVETFLFSRNDQGLVLE